MRKRLLLLLLALASIASAQEFDFGEPSAAAVPALAKRVMTATSDMDLENRFHLQIVAGDYAAAVNTFNALQEQRRKTLPEFAPWMDVQYAIYARAKASEASKQLPFEEAYRQSFHDVLQSMSDPAAARLLRAMAVDPKSFGFDRAVQRDLDARKGKTTIAPADAFKLVKDVMVADTYNAASPFLQQLIDGDDARRYTIQRDVPVKMPDGATICALIVRPRNAERLPALLEFTIYADTRLLERARLSASYGYDAVIGLTRGKGCSPDKPVPYEYDGADAAALIRWIAIQPWSDGRVGMYGGSYSGFTAWAAAKHMPKALKAIAVGAPAAPGIDVPMEGNVAWNFVYPWPFYTTDNKMLDDAVYGDNARWTRLNQQWYSTGRAYRDLDKIDGTPNPLFDQWIAHPDYDAYWQRMIPYRDDFARIDIPVLQTAGYYFGGPGAAVYYCTQHQKYNPHAQSYLLIGPWHHFNAQVGTYGLFGQPYPTIAGYTLDSVAMMDIEALRYEWFDFVLKKGPRPALLQDKVNYEVTGANEWKHAPTIAAMANDKLHFRLAKGSDFVTQKIDFADRTDVKREAPGGGVLDKVVDTWNGIEFISDPLPVTTEFSGLFSGTLDFVADKKDFDFEIDLYAQTPQGEYMQLAPYWSRASYAGDLGHRHLLTPGKRERRSFRAVRLMSYKAAAGSRIVAVLSVIKGPDRQINYGTGRDVNAETIADAKTPLEIRWYSDSYIDLPVRK